MYFFLFLLTVASIIGLQTWQTLFNNFAVEQAGVNGYQMGVIQSVREIPGFLALLVIYVIRFIPEHKLGAFSIIFLGIGVGLTGFMPTYYGLIFTTIVMSFGFHYYETVNQSLTLQYFTKQETPLVLSRFRSISAACSIIVGVIVMGMLKVFDYKTIYLLVGVFLTAGGVYCLFIDPTKQNMPVQRKSMFMRKKYWLYYVLTFLAGARRQIFVAFSVFLMVEKFGFSAFVIAMLFVVNNAVNYFLNPMIGKAINKFGERGVLSLEYVSLIGVFLAYAYVDNKWIIAVMYILDHIFFNFSVAIRTFFQKIGDSGDIAPTMAIGFTINHIAAVVIPLIGGLLWMLDYRIPFVAGAVLAFVSLVFTQLIDRDLKLKEQA
ncbi:MFS transporter [Geovibrio thiophilus]|uniref:MFS transporter n=2 Tax=Geovibrio thiophilus TaxID=139438 RepID=A0A410K213_9BACT|nr:MFS transporter [Geovibrio thiophilus]